MKGKSTTRQTYFCDDLSIKAKISSLLSISERTFIVSFSFSFNLTGIVSFCHKLTFPLSKNHKIKFQTHFSFSEKSTFLYLNSWVCLIGQAKKRYSLALVRRTLGLVRSTILGIRLGRWRLRPCLNGRIQHW